MENKKIDRRITRSRQSLKDAFISLINEKEFTDISITDLVNCSNLNRSTFYTHFRDKEDLLTCMIDELIDGMIKSMQGSTIIDLNKIHKKGSLTHATTKLFTYVADHSIYFKAMLSNKGFPQFILLLSESLYKFCLNEIEKQPDSEIELIINKGFFANYLTSTIVGFIFHWLITTNMKYSPDYIAKEFNKIIISKPYILH